MDVSPQNGLGRQDCKSWGEQSRTDIESLTERTAAVRVGKLTDVAFRLLVKQGTPRQRQAHRGHAITPKRRSLDTIVVNRLGVSRDNDPAAASCVAERARPHKMLGSSSPTTPTESPLTIALADLSRVDRARHADGCQHLPRHTQT